MAKRAPRLKLLNGRSENRPNSNQRLYDYQWRKARRLKLQANPLCEDCEERDEATIAVDVHHELKVRDHPDLRLCQDNLRSLCKTCHSIRTNRGE